MVLETLKEELIRSLHRECPDFSVYGERIRQDFGRPCLTVQLKSGKISWERGWSRITADFRLNVFGEEENRQYSRLGQIAAAAQGLPAACTGLAFESGSDSLQVQLSFVMRARLTEKTEEKMKKLTEDMKIG